MPKVDFVILWAERGTRSHSLHLGTNCACRRRGLNVSVNECHRFDAQRSRMFLFYTFAVMGREIDMNLNVHATDEAAHKVWRNLSRLELRQRKADT